MTQNEREEGNTWGTLSKQLHYAMLKAIATTSEFGTLDTNSPVVILTISGKVTAEHFEPQGGMLGDACL